MNEQVIRDRDNRLIGTIRQRPDGKLEARDRDEKLKGIYDPIKDETRDANQRFVGQGNQLSGVF